MKGKFSLVVAVCLFFVGAVQAQNGLRVDEAATKAFIKTDELKTDLVFVNKSAALAATIRLEILDVNDKILSQSVVQKNIRRGRQIVSASLPFSYPNNSTEYLWYRLRYTVDAPDKPTVGGIISLSEITPEIFELRVAAGETVFSGMNYRVRVRAFQPVTNAPMPQVKITGEVELDTNVTVDGLILKAANVTDKNGYAVLEFKIPPDVKLDNDGDVKITGEKNGIVREAEEDLDAAETDFSVYLNTDKPIYQPNQKLSVRGLFMRRGISEQVTKAVGGQELEFIVKDEDDTVLYRETVRTSRFGIASINWQIPENAKLGTYRVIVEADEELNGDRIYFKVSRYDLPNFSVVAKPAKTFYLPGENAAEISVSADYLFGKPVTKGTIKIVQETSREWNYKAQKWTVEEERSYTGETDADGKYTARVDLSEAHENLKTEEYRRFEDLHFAAYFTDATTNRTEQKRFDVRVTKAAIHVYLVGINSDDYSPKLPIQFYVSTFYADGAAASCAVEIRGKYESEDAKKRRIFARAKTNALGAAKIELPRLKPDADDYYDDLQITVFAADADSRTGTQEEEISVDEDAKQIRLSTNKTIYRTGEPIKIEIISTESDRDVFVEIVQNESAIESRLVRLKNGRAQIKIPYNPAFKNNLTVVAYIDDNDETVKFSRGVFYPNPTNLQLDASPVQTTYHPNEEAKVNFTVASADKKAGGETALGVIVFDRAIEERAATDAAFGGSNVSQFGSYLDLLDSDLSRIDVSKPIAEDLQLKVELLLSDSRFNPNFFESGEYDGNLKNIFKGFFNRQFPTIEAALKTRYAANYEHPTDENSLRRILLEQGIDYEKLRDPWGVSYKAVFTIERDRNVIIIKSAGVNKSFGAADDLTVLELKFYYFTPIGQAIDRAVNDYYAATKNFIWDYETLKYELKKQNVDLESLRDRWNNPYRINFGVSDRFYTIDFTSGGDDWKVNYSDNDFSVWVNRTDYIAEIETRLQTILSNYASEKKTFLKNEIEFKAILKSGGIDFDQLRDGWNRPLELKFETFARFSDRMKTESAAKFGEAAKERTIITPVTQQVAVFRVQSAGADGEFGNYGDATLMTFSGVISEQSKSDATPVELKTETIFTGGKGALRGTITDATGAVVPGAKVTAINEQSEVEYEAVSDENGVYILKNLLSGKYKIQIESLGFSTSVVENAPVRSSNITELNFTLNVGGVSSVVEVTADVSVNATSSLSAATVVTEYRKTPDAAVIEEKSTPRLREYFPETLVWQPELITDKNGKAELKFKLGDNITTWKLYAIASNADGNIGIAQQEIKAFQPFFVDLEPPKFLTVGDEIFLPVQIRNYNDAKQKVNVEMAKGDWFDFLNQATKQIEVAPNDSQNAIFGFRANTTVRNGKQKVTANADKDSDAIEKPVTVRPNGKEIVQTASEIFLESAAFDVVFPADALPDTQRAELKIYPNLLAHVTESIEGLLQRPYGCGEQTISSTYPNLMILKFALKDGKIRAQANNYLGKGYERLLGYQQSDGGFSVWAKDAPDVALTAYALRFLTDAKDYIAVDQEVIKRARTWLIKQQRTDGGWTRQYSQEKTEDKKRTKLMTGYAARTLAMIEKGTKDKESATALRRGLEFLKTRNDEIDEPYALALFGLASLDAGNLEDAKIIAAKLETMAISEGAGAYWNLETNTPFYGWGTAGRIETTALVVQLLLNVQKLNSEVQSQSESKLTSLKSEISNLKVKDDGQTANLISKGTQFLLKNKDRYGVWHSTQTTINVLDAFLAAIGDGAADTAAENRAAEVFVNGRKFKDVTLPPENAPAFPINLDLPLSANANRIELKIVGNKSATMAQIVGTHYVGWQNYEANGRNENQTRALRLDYKCDQQFAKPTEEITCNVEAERIGFKGYRMLLAEIGLPPGAEVNRASLEKAKDENWNFSRYDVLPDRIVVYLWVQAGGTKFSFNFKPRYGINAQTAPSTVYDYYNPEAQATVAPLKFIVK